MGNNFEVFLGIVAENRTMKSREIKVFLRDLAPYASGKLGDNTRNEKYTVDGDTGSKMQGNVSTTNVVVADYFGLEDNRSTVPDVVRGEQVIVLKYADEDKYYWESLNRNSNLRTGELVRWIASNDKAQNKELTENNTYFLELDTKIAKRIRLHTSKSNGEAFGYDIVIDGMNNYLTICDDAGNRIDLFSKESRVKISNKEGSTIDLNGPNIVTMAPGTLFIRSANNIITGNTTIDGELSAKNISAANVSSSGTITSAGPVTAPNI